MLRSLVGSEMCIRDRVAMQSPELLDFYNYNRVEPWLRDRLCRAGVCHLEDLKTLTPTRAGQLGVSARIQSVLRNWKLGIDSLKIKGSRAVLGRHSTRIGFRPASANLNFGARSVLRADHASLAPSVRPRPRTAHCHDRHPRHCHDNTVIVQSSPLAWRGGRGRSGRVANRTFTLDLS
eukprot:TRINITY_DN6085_c0_g1_i1.p1 TRINITY_DN6085_c0_g1~~TRINITY_DN6085_c0_g1_i1.p1  ORF type:complete len:193 (-),score=30.59 TRINITY_DN6085_c0_g1_i1:270-803(-)